VLEAVKAVETVENRLGCLPPCWQLTAHSWEGEEGDPPPLPLPHKPFAFEGGPGREGPGREGPGRREGRPFSRAQSPKEEMGEGESESERRGGAKKTVLVQI
jgi:hypothetical protein